MGIFMPDVPPDKTDKIRESLDAQIKGIQLKLSTIEEAILNQKKQASRAPTHSISAKNPEALARLDQKLDMILGKLAVLENKSTAAQAPQTFARSFGPPPMVPRQLPPSFSAKGENPTGWIDSLPDNKKREVEIIFEEHLQRMRDNLPPPDPDGRLPDRETITRIVKENDLLFKQELQAILNEKEYRQFLDSHPEPAILSPKPPAIRGNSAN
jgi:hypothetical protein